MSIKKQCSLWYCIGSYYARGLCKRHYGRQIATDNVLGKNRDARVMLDVLDGYAVPLAKAVVSNVPNTSHAGIPGKQCYYCEYSDERRIPHGDDCPVAVAKLFLDTVEEGW